jgi:hypothetical protein
MKLDELKDYAEQVSCHSRKLVASTENLLMPMIQFSFLFPTILMLSISIDFRVRTLFKDLSTNWTSWLIISSTISSLISLGASQTSIHFATPGKRNQRTLVNRVLIFIIIMLQVLPKLLASQAFAFGCFGSKFGHPDAILVFLFFFPIASAVWKTLMIALCLYASSYQLSWHKIQSLFLYPFICTRIEETNDDVMDQSNSKNKNSSISIFLF